MARKSSPIGVRLTPAIRARIRAFVTETRSEHATLQVLLLLGLETAEKNPKALDLAKASPMHPLWKRLTRIFRGCRSRLNSPLHQGG
jgi:hypothetical protein